MPRRKSFCIYPQLTGEGPYAAMAYYHDHREEVREHIGRVKPS